jgi:hypothetical protein
MSKIDISGVLYIEGNLTEEVELEMFFDKQCKGEKIRVNSAINDGTDKKQGFTVTVSPIVEKATVKTKKATKKKKKKK